MLRFIETFAQGLFCKKGATIIAKPIISKYCTIDLC